MSSTGPLAVCQSGYEGLLAKELERSGHGSAEQGPGWVLAGPDSPALGIALRSSAFTHAFVEAPVRIRAGGVNEFAKAIADYFSDGVRGERIDEPWPCVFLGVQDAPGLGRRISSVEAAFHELLRGRLGRVAKLATPVRPRLGPARGLHVWFSDFDHAFVGRSAHMNGQRRMADDPAAPSRSYLKVEEAYGVIGAEPCAGDRVCDLGAAPGGWSYSAAKRGARVVAVDNGPLKGGALGHPLIEHRRSDAFGFRPEPGSHFDWLFCDLLEDPRKVLVEIVIPWLSAGACRRFVVNLKFGRVDPIALLGEIRAAGAPLGKRAPGARVLHLYHDRDEFTIAGTIPE